MAMDKVIKHGLELSVGWDQKSQNRMRDAVRNVFTEEAHIDFANPENIHGLKTLGEMMRKIFTQAGETKFDFDGILDLKDASKMFAGLKDAAMEFDRVWDSLIANMSSFSFKDMFMRDASEVSSALQRITDKNGKIIKANIRDIQRAFEEISTFDQNKLFGNLLSAEKAMQGARTWEARTAAALEYVNIYEKILKLTDGDVAALDVDKKYMKYAERSLSPKNKVAGVYSVDSLREAMPQMQTSLQNIFNMAMGKALTGLTDGGVIDVNVAPVVINKLDLGDLFDKKISGGTISVPVVPEIDPGFKDKIEKLFEAYKKNDFKTSGDIEDELLGGMSEKAYDAALDRLSKIAKLNSITNRSANAVWKDLLGLGMTVGGGTSGGFGSGTGTGNGTGSGDASAAELAAAQTKIGELESEVESLKTEIEDIKKKAMKEPQPKKKMVAHEEVMKLQKQITERESEIDELRAELSRKSGAGIGTGSGDNALQQLQKDAEAASHAFEEATNRLHEIYEAERRLDEQIANSGLIDYDEKIQSAEGARDNTLSALQKTLSKKADHKGNVEEMQSIIRNMIDKGALSGISKPTDLYFVEQYMNAVADYSKHTNVELNNLLEKAVSTIDRKTKETISEYKDAQRRQEEDDPNGLIAKRRKLAEEHAAASKAYNEAADAQQAAYDKLHAAQERGGSIGSGSGPIRTEEDVENANKLADAIQRVEAAYKELDALNADPWEIKNEEEVNRILQERLAIIQRVGAENLKTYNPDAYEYVEYINDQYDSVLDSIAESRDDAIYDNLDENFGYNNDIIESSQTLEVLLAKRRELMQGITFDAEQEYLEQEEINKAIEHRIALMKQYEPFVANGSIAQDQLGEMVFEQGTLDERRNILEGLLTDQFGNEPEDIDEAQALFDQYEKILVETGSGKKLTLGPEMSPEDWDKFTKCNIDAIKSIEFVRKEMQQTSQEAEQQAEVQVQANDSEIESNKEKIKSYEELSAAVSRYIELAKTLVDTEKNTPEHQQITRDMEYADTYGMRDQESYIEEINRWQKNISRIKSAIKFGDSSYKDDDGNEYDIVEDTLSKAESKLRGYIYHYAENFDDISSLVDGAKTKGLKSVINKEVSKFRVDEDIQRQQEEIAEAANAAALAEMEQIENLIENSAPTEKLDKVLDTIHNLKYRANDVDRFTQSLETDRLADDIGIISPHKEIENNAKAIKSYEDLCDVVARYNELIKKRYTYSANQSPTPSEDEENEFAELVGRLNATRDGVKVTWKELEGDISKLAQLLGIEIPQAAQQAETAVDGLNNELAETGDKADNIGEQTGGSIAGAGAGQTGGETSGEVKNLNDVRDAVSKVTAEVKEKTQEFLNEQSVVKKVSDSEVHALGEVEKKATAIRVALSNVNTLLNNIQKGNDISALSDVKVTVNYPEQQDDYSKLAEAIKSSIEQLNEGKQGDAESQWEKSVITLLTRIKVHTHNTVRQVRDNLVGKVDEKLSELNGLKDATYNVKIVNDGQSKDDGKWALEDTLRNKTNDLLGKIVTHSNTTKTNTKDTAKDSTLKQVLNSINTKVKSQSISFGPPPANQSDKKPVIAGAGGNILKMYEHLGALGVQKNALDLNSDERKGIKEKIRLLKEEIDKKKKLVTVDKQLIVEAQKKGAADQRAQMMTVQGHKSDIQAAKDEKKAISDLLAAYERLGTLRAKRDALPKGAEREELQKEIKLETSRLWKRSKKLGVDSAKTIEASALGEHSVQMDKLVTKTQLLGKYQKSILSMENDSESYKNAQNRINELTAEIALIRNKITLTQEEKLELDELIKKNEELINVKKSEQADKEAKNKEREASIHNAQVEAEVVKELIKLYEQLGRAQATENVDEASRLRDVVSTERGKLSSVDYATDMKFKDAKSKGFEAEKTKAANAALKTQEDAIKRLNKLYQEYGVLVERASAATGHFGEQLQDEVADKSQEIMTLRESIGFITTEMLDGFDVSFERGRQIESTKQYEALAKKSDSDEATRLKNIANLEKEIGKLGADADAATNVGVQNALEEEIQLRQQLIELQRQGLEMDALDEAYYRQAAANRTKQAKSEASQEIKDVKNAFKQADKDAKKQAAEDKRQAKRNAMFGKAGNAIGRAENIWMSAQGEDEPLPPGLSKQVEDLYDKMVALRAEQDKVRTAESVTPEQQEDLRNHTIEMNALTNEVSELYSEYQKLSGANVDETKTKATTLTGKSSVSAYEAELKQYVKTIEHGKAQIKGFDATTKTLTYTVKTGKNEFTEYTAAVRRADGALVSMRGATKRTETFLEATKRKMKELTSYMSGMALFSRIGQELRRGVQYVREIDLALTELKKVTNETEEEYDQFLKTAAKTGARLGTTISAVTEATSTFAKLGYTMEQATEMAESAIVYKNVGDNIESTGDAADSIISTMKGFGLEASESMAIVDRFNEVGNRFAITSQGIGEALRLSASALSEGSNSLDESIGLITAANEVVNDPSSVGKISLPT